jgi:hypothetical protein
MGNVLRDNQKRTTDSHSAMTCGIGFPACHGIATCRAHKALRQESPFNENCPAVHNPFEGHVTIGARLKLRMMYLLNKSGGLLSPERYWITAFPKTVMLCFFVIPANAGIQRADP